MRAKKNLGSEGTAGPEQAPRAPFRVMKRGEDDQKQALNGKKEWNSAGVLEAGRFVGAL